MRRLLRYTKIVWSFAIGLGVTFSFLAATTYGQTTDATQTHSWQVGVAKRKITPEGPIWLSGYASRDHESTGVLTDLWAKALCLSDGRGHRAVIITLDLIGIGRPLSQIICGRLEQEFELARADISICTSHTHTGPVVGKNLYSMYTQKLTSAQADRVARYADSLIEAVVQVTGEALGAMEPGALTWGSGRAAFAVNRRNNPEREVPARRAASRLIGPQDHDVPVLAFKNDAGAYRALVFGYACHSTVLSSYEISGDYGGFAQMSLEQDFADCVAFFWAGCGADQNPLPRRSNELAKKYGYELAGAVKQVITDGPMSPVEGPLATVYREINLRYDQLPTVEEIRMDAASSNEYVASRAQSLLAQIEGGKPLSEVYPYPVASWKLGDSLQWVFLGGEVVVDYALRLKTEQRGVSTWVAAYANDVMAYIPSRRVWREGGYEGGGAMVYYGLPTRWSPDVEAQVFTELNRQLNGVSVGDPQR